MLISKVARLKWSSVIKKYYENKGYVFTKMRDEFEVKLEDLTSGSKGLIDYQCDGCKEIFTIGWTDYRRRTKGDVEHYCPKCARAGFKKWISFYDWCYENLSHEEADEIILRWDNDMNIDSLGKFMGPKDVAKGSYFRRYWFKCIKHPEHSPEEKDIHSFTGGETGSIKCKQCNAISVTHPHLAKYLANKEDALRCSIGSHEQIPVKCPVCGYEKMMDIHVLGKAGLGCNKCSDGISYPEKFIFNILEQANVNFEIQLSIKTFEWCVSYRYDFYMPSLNCIIETHGRQHYEEHKGNYWGSLKEIQENDKLKELLARKNGIKNYIVLDCRNSEMEWIKDSITKSELSRLLVLNNIDWVKCVEYACSTLVKKVSDLRNSGIVRTTEIADMLRIGEDRTRRYLKQANELGWCTYDAKEEMEKVYALMRIKPFSVCKQVICLTTGEIFNSQADAKRKYGANDISSCCNKKRKHSGFHPETGVRLAWDYYGEQCAKLVQTLA